jgi:hypothetical protein
MGYMEFGDTPYDTEQENYYFTCWKETDAEPCNEWEEEDDAGQGSIESKCPKCGTLVTSGECDTDRQEARNDDDREAHEYLEALYWSEQLYI